jgi:hypothetical protein
MSSGKAPYIKAIAKKQKSKYSQQDENVYLLAIRIKICK